MTFGIRAWSHQASISNAVLVNTLTMPRGMTNANRFKAIEAALRDFKGVIDVVQTMQTKEILKLFQRA